MRVLITGADGRLGRELCDAFADHDVEPTTRDVLDVTVEGAVHATVRAVAPDVVVNAAGWADVDACEADPTAAHRAHALAPWWLAGACRDVGASLVTFSSDYVFDGAPVDAPTRDRGYAETATPAPLNVYGRAKLAGERLVAQTLDAHHVVRTSWCFGVHGESFVTRVLAAARAHGVVDVVTDEVGTPTSTRDLARAVRALVAARRYGVVHLANTGICSRYELARQAVELAGLDAVVRPVSGPGVGPPRAAVRPAFSALDTTHAAAVGIGPLPCWQQALAQALVAGPATTAGRST